ncbi:MAG: Tex family protein [Elainellaceae cyanobacterium]
MADLISQLAQALSLSTGQVTQALQLMGEGATIPFIARYRKERTGQMDETQLRALAESYAYQTELQERRQAILAAIEKQGELTDTLRKAIAACSQKTELEDLYLPYRPKRRTRATAARERGLEPLAADIDALNNRRAPRRSLEKLAQTYLNDEVPTAQDALQGTADIIAEGVAETASYRAWCRHYFSNKGVLKSRIAKAPEGSTKFEMYRDYQTPVRSVAPHNLLALYRGAAEGVLNFRLDVDQDAALAYLERQEICTQDPDVRQFYQALIRDAFTRLMKPSITSDVLAQKKQEADEASIETFAVNLRHLLLASPAGMKPTLGIDPGFRTGCKVAVLDETGQFLEYQAIFPHGSAAQRQTAAQTLTRLIKQYQIELVAIGNGTASRETDGFVSEVLAPLPHKPIKVMVNEAGASIYSASPVAIAEFPDLDVTVRGAISIGRRLQDPLAELVKIDPKSIGVGQYQHDVDQKRLKQKLAETVTSCVNYVGVDLNTASKDLLTFVSGLTPAVAGNILTHRNQHGAFRNRRQLMKVAKLGPKAFEQAAGFLRIRDGDNPLDQTAVHPERYGAVKAIAADMKVPVGEPARLAAALKQADLTHYINDSLGLPTLQDIVAELEKPGRDPREQFTYAQFRDDINALSDLAPGMTLEGVVTNVANFGAFVDIGVHQDGLVHVSQLADRFVADPKTIVSVGQVVQVRVLEVDQARKRVSLSMRQDPGAMDPGDKPRPSRPSQTSSGPLRRRQ